MTANQRPQSRSENDSGIPGLTRSELLCLTMVAEGMTVDVIRSELSLTSTELEFLLFCAQRKLNAGNLLQAVSIALAKGYISL